MNPNTQMAKAAALLNGGKLTEAATIYRTLLRHNKNDPLSIFNLSLILLRQRKLSEGLTLIERGVAIAPRFAPMHLCRALLLEASGHIEAALKNYEAAIALQPDYEDALLNAGVILNHLLRHDEALERFEQVLRINPRQLGALSNSAILLAQLKQPQLAIERFERLLQLNPQFPNGLGLLCYEYLRACEWTHLETLTQAILQGVRASQPVCMALMLKSLPSSAHDQLLCARTYSRHNIAKPDKALWQGEVYQHARLRVAYVSPDFREHPVSHLMSGVFERHDRQRFETLGISIGINDHSPMRARLEQSFDQFHDLAGQSSLQVAKKIRELEVDILIDLAGYTWDAKLDIFAHRPAPIQAGFLGFPGTLGTDFMDYILADRQVIPDDHQDCYAEKVAYLPDTYLPTDATVRISEETPSRESLGLPATGAVLCAFNHNFKLNPAMFDVWMRLLKQLPGSVLWLSTGPGIARDNLRREATARGVDASRLVFADRVPKVEDHLARYRVADVFLDTSPYNAHTTAADALMAGLPVITLQGDAFASRVASSLLHAIGLPELVTSTAADYEALALSLLTNPARLAELKARLQANRHTHPLFDTERFCRNFETLLLTLKPAAANTVKA